MKKLLAVVLACVMAAAICACGSSSTSTTAATEAAATEAATTVAATEAATTVAATEAATTAEIVDNGDGTYTGMVDFQTGSGATPVTISFDDTSFEATFEMVDFGETLTLRGTIDNGVLTVTEEEGGSIEGLGLMLIGFIQDQLYTPLVSK